MTVTIAPQNNIQYCEQFNLYSVEWLDCYCAFGSDANPECIDCGGEGRVGLTHRPFEATLSNLNFCRLWNDLGYDFPQDGGEVSPVDLIGRLGNPELSVRPSEYTDTGAGVLVRGGLSLTQVTRYHHIIKNICEESRKRGVFVSWG